MTTPTGTIGASDVNIELGRVYYNVINLNESPVRTLAGVPSGTISMNNLRGKSNLSWSHANGSYDTGWVDSYASITLSCSQVANWSYNRTGSTSSGPATGSRANTFVTFFASAGVVNVQTQWNVTATAGGQTRTYTISCRALGTPE